MKGIQEMTEDIRFSLEKKRKAITRVRNESGALQAELQRTLDSHEQEKAMLEELKNELENETEERIKAKNGLELEFKKLQMELERHTDQVDNFLHDMEYRLVTATDTTEETTADVDQAEETVDAVTNEFEAKTTDMKSRKQRVQGSTDSSVKSIFDYKEKIKQLQSSRIHLTTERDGLIDPYKQLITEHSTETARYNSLKCDVLALNGQLKNANIEIAECNETIHDMQEPRQVLHEKLDSSRGDMSTNNATDRECLFKVQRRTYEISRKLEEYRNRNDEIESLARETLASTIYNSRLLRQISRAHGKQQDKGTADTEILEEIKRERAKTVKTILAHGKAFSAKFEEFFIELVNELQVLDSVSGGLSKSIESIRIADDMNAKVKNICSAKKSVKKWTAKNSAKK